jgi:murein DD-endopeptidase MepM/ murein hydrolase activator NlpD
MKRLLLLAGLGLTLAACVPERYLAPQPNAAAPAPAPASSGGGSAAVVVQHGESLSRIAQREGVSTRAMAEANGLHAPYVIRPGQRLVVPRPGGATAAPAATSSPTPENGEVLIRPRDQVDRQDLAPLTTAPTPVRPEQGHPDAARSDAARSTRTPAARADTQHQEAAQAGAARAAAPAAPAAETPRQEASATPGRAADDATPPPRASRLFLWPVQGRIVSDFGPKPNGLHNDGINIAAARGTPIQAAENGVVVYAGNELRGFGNLLLVRHADGWVTAYGHCDQLLVRRGQQVRRGQTIAKVGSTGNVRAPQLHFEVRRGTRPVNPSEYLEQ